MGKYVRVSETGAHWKHDPQYLETQKHGIDNTKNIYSHYSIIYVAHYLGRKK